MNCATLQQMIDRIIEGGLNPDEKAEVFLHLRQCDECDDLVRLYAESMVKLPNEEAAALTSYIP